MKSNGRNQHRKFEAAVAALLVSPTLEAAAQLAGISEPTLGRWLKDPEFTVLYRQARREVVERAIGQLQQACGEAVQALRRAMSSGSPQVEVSAARTVLDKAIQGLELADLQTKVEQLEALLSRLKGGEGDGSSSALHNVHDA